ncbi:hypothetical protein BSFA1_10440 [Burkholderia sp. SFA1]|nr:hypothetical protein BSFA1_10440 [Burkholderia sp. SFA1]
MSSPMHRVIDSPPYRIVVNASKRFRDGSPDDIEGYVAQAVIDRPDGKPVYKNFLRFQVKEGPIHGDLQESLKECEQRARDAINRDFAEE